MLWLIQNILFSISLIVVIHYLYIYFETTLTAPKVKDLIHCPKQKYKSLFDTINKNLDNNHLSQKGRNLGGDESETVVGGITGDGTEVGILPKNYNDPPKNTSQSMSDDRNSMKTDLKAFLRGIGLKSKSNADSLFRASYETS